VTIWDEWADEDGDLGPVYGKQWREWSAENGYIDQIADLMRNLKTNPYSRRHVVSAWNVGDLPVDGRAPNTQPLYGHMALAPCHVLWQVYVSHVDDSVSLHLYQRSADYFLGVPFNIASYALLTHMIAHQLDRPVGKLVMSFGDVHLYANHVEQAEILSNRLETKYDAPTIEFKRKPESIWEYKYEDIELIGYNSYPAIPAPIAV
jgi:thymidylate synthase